MWCVMRIEREHMGTGNEQCMLHGMIVGNVKMWDVRTTRNGQCMWLVMRIEREHMYISILGTGNEQCMWHAMRVGNMNMWVVWTTGNGKCSWCARSMKYELNISYFRQLQNTGNEAGM